MDGTVTKADLLARIATGWDALSSFVGSLSETQLTAGTDAAGWTAKDHIAHLAAWESATTALLTRRSQWEVLGIAPGTTKTLDNVNAVIQQRTKDQPLDQVLIALHSEHAALVAAIEALDDTDLQLPFNDFEPGSAKETAIGESLPGYTYEHYDEHIPWIAAIIDETGGP